MMSKSYSSSTKILCRNQTANFAKSKQLRITDLDVTMFYAGDVYVTLMHELYAGMKEIGFLSGK